MCELDTNLLTGEELFILLLCYSEAIFLTFELIVVLSLKPLSISVHCMSHLNKIYYYYQYLHLHRVCKLSLSKLS